MRPGPLPGRGQPSVNGDVLIGLAIGAVALVIGGARHLIDYARHHAR